MEYNSELTITASVVESENSKPPFDKVLILSGGMITLTIPLRDCQHNFELLVNRHTDWIEWLTLLYLWTIYKDKMQKVGIHFYDHAFISPGFFLAKEQN